MYTESERILLRSIQYGDEKAFAKMAKDGSLAEIGFDESFSDWADGWIKEAIDLTKKDYPRADYIPCTIVLKSTGEVIGSVGCTYFGDTDRIGICYFAGAKYRKKGYVKEAVACKYCMNSTYVLHVPIFICVLRNMEVPTVFAHKNQPDYLLCFADRPAE